MLFPTDGQSKVYLGLSQTARKHQSDKQLLIFSCTVVVAVGDILWAYFFLGYYCLLYPILSCCCFCSDMTALRWLGSFSESPRHIYVGTKKAHRTVM